MQRGKTPQNECPGDDAKRSNVETPVMLEHWGMQSTASLSSLLGPIWSGAVAHDRVLCRGQIELFDI